MTMYDCVVEEEPPETKAEDAGFPSIHDEFSRYIAVRIATGSDDLWEEFNGMPRE